MRWRWVVISGLLSACGADGGAGDEGAGDVASSAESGGAAADASGGGPGDDGGGPGGEGPNGDPDTEGDSGGTDDTGTPDPTDTGGGDDPSAYCGQVLFSEPFEDTDFAARGWYDALSGTLSTDEYIEGSTASLECRFAPGATGCEGGTPGRHPLEENTAVCLDYWVKYSDGYVGSGVSYHPHEFHFITNIDDDFVGPASTHLTTYVEQVGGVPRLVVQDSRNVDPNCVLFDNDEFSGCNGDFDSYPFTEERSVAACNGLQGDLDGRSCFAAGDGYYSARFWDADAQVFGLDTQWHHVVSYWRLNDIEDGVGVPNGVMRYWVDGALIIESDAILLRTGAHPDMAFDQFLLAPYIGDGSPIDQTMWVDELTVHAGVP